MTTGKTIALTRQTFVGIVMSLLLNMLSIEYFVLKSLSGFGSQTRILGSLEVVARFFLMG